MRQPITTPTLGIGGRYNLAERVAMALKTAATNVSTAVVENAGHWVSDENPEDLTRILVNFFGARP